MCAAAIPFLSIHWLDRYAPSGALVLIALISAVAVGLAYVALRQHDSVNRWVARELALLGASLLVVEAAMAILAPELPSPQLSRKRVADKLGIPFDSRTVSEVVAELRSQGVDALPGISRPWPQHPRVSERLGDSIYPLSHASRATVVECNEDGRYLTYRTDEFGFNNPPGLIASGNVDLAIVGESFALGHCLPEGQTLLGILRRAYPRTATFARAGNGTLAELASFREYVEPHRPRVVLWTVMPEFVVPRSEVEDPLLTRYLEPTFSQRLLERQPEVDRVIRELAIPIQAEMDREAKLEIRRVYVRRFERLFLLPELRARVFPQMRNKLGVAKASSSQGPDLAPFVESVRLAQETAEQWGGELVVLLLPTFKEVVANQVESPFRHDRLAAALRGTGVAVIDGAALFLEQEDPAGLYTMRINNHPTPQGYALLGNHVVDRLQQPMSAQRRAGHSGQAAAR